MAADPVTASTVDDLLNFDFSDTEDPFADKSVAKSRDDKPALSPRSAKRKLDENKENLGLGLDEEVKITKKRKPIVKLDEARLLSELGIPRLRALARSGKVAKKLGFKGKGHEFTDIARMLNYYQLWLDGLYPRAKFADGLQLIEKAGHSKRMNIMRKEWIDEGKPGYIRRFESGQENSMDSGTTPEQRQNVNGTKNDEGHEDGTGDDLFFQDSGAAEKPRDSIEPDDDELDALLAQPDSGPKSATSLNPGDSEGEDDLDALLAEQDSRNTPKPKPTQNPIEDDEDDLDALLAEQESDRPQAAIAIDSGRKRNNLFDEDDFEDEGDLEALLAEQTTQEALVANLDHQSEGSPKNKSSEGQIESQDNVLSSSPLPNNPEEEDDLDALLADHEALR